MAEETKEEMTLKEIIKIDLALGVVSSMSPPRDKETGKLQGDPITASVGYRINKNRKLIRSQIEIYDETRAMYANQHGIPKDRKGDYHVPDEKVVDWNKMLDELKSKKEEVHIGRVKTIRMSDNGGKCDIPDWVPSSVYFPLMDFCIEEN